MYQIALPAPALRPYIECYWYVQQHLSAQESLQELLIVDAKADLLFNFGNPYQRYRVDSATVNLPVSLTASNFDAQRHFPLTISQIGSIRLLGVRFKVLGASAFIKIPLYQLSDMTHEPCLVFGNSVRTLENRLYEAPTYEAQCQLLNTFFLARLNPPPQFLTVTNAVRTIQEAYGKITIPVLSLESGYSPRNLNRLFQAMIGFSPKHYARIVRFQFALQQLAHNPSLNLAEIAYTAGYYDQSHFNRDFLEFAGISPETYFA